MKNNKSNKICLVCSSGGHLFQLYSLKHFWEKLDRVWVSFNTQDAIHLLKDEKKYWAYFPTNRNSINFFRNTILALRIIKKEKPILVISTGAGVGVPFIIISKLLKIHTVYIESITRNEELSLSALIIYPFVDKILVQWEDLSFKYKKAEYKGQVL